MPFLWNCPMIMDVCRMDKFSSAVSRLQEMVCCTVCLGTTWDVALHRNRTQIEPENYSIGGCSCTSRNWKNFNPPLALHKIDDVEWGVCPLFWLGFKVWYRFAGSPALLPVLDSRRLPENEPPTLGKSATDFGKFNHRLWENQPPTLGKWAPDFGKINHPLRENEPPTAGKWATNFGIMSHRLWEKMSHRFWENEPQENQRPTLGKSANDFRKISHRLRENQRTTSGKSATDYGKISHRFWGNEPPALGKWAPATHGNSKQIISKNIIK